MFVEFTSLLDLRERQQAVGQRLEALRLRFDVLQKPLALVYRHVTTQQLCRSANRGERTLELVRERLHVALDVCLAVEFTAHTLERLSQLRQLPAGKLRHLGAFARTYSSRITCQTLDCMAQPIRQGGAQQQA